MAEPHPTLPSVIAPLDSRLEVRAEKPAFSFHHPLPENPRRGPQLGPRERSIHDARPLRSGLSLDAEGLQLVDAKTSFDAFDDPDRVRESYYPEIEKLVKENTGARRVVAFDHNQRSKALAPENQFGARMPVLFAHNDYTEDSGRSASATCFPIKRTNSSPNASRSSTSGGRRADS